MKFRNYVQSHIKAFREKVGEENINKWELQYGSIGSFIAKDLAAQMKKWFKFNPDIFNLKIDEREYDPVSDGFFGTQGNLMQVFGQIPMRYEDRIISERKKTGDIKQWKKSIRMLNSVSPGIGTRSMT